MRVLQSLTGNATHMDGRERLYTDRDGNAKVALAEGPLCNGVGASRGNVRWYERKAKAVTCKSCLRILAKVHAEAITENEIRTLKADARADLAEVATEAAPKPAARRPVTEADMVVGAVVFKGNGKTAYRVYAVRTVSVYGGGTELRAGLVKTTTKNDPSRSTWWAASELTTEQAEAERPAEARAMHAEVQAVPAAAGEDVAAMTGDPVGWVTSMLKDEEERSGMYVELSSGLTEYVEPGERLQHKDSGARGTVTAVGPNALDLRMDNDTAWSGASWFWGRPSADGPAESGPIDRQAVLATRVDSLLDSGVTDAQRLAELEQEGPLSRQLRALGSQAGSTVVKVLGDGSTVVDVLEDEQEATPAMVAELTTAIAEQAELFAAGGVSSDAAGAFRSRMVGNVRTLARWLGMSEPVELASFASPYGGPDLVDEVRRAHV